MTLLKYVAVRLALLKDQQTYNEVLNNKLPMRPRMKFSPSAGFSSDGGRIK
jgi:hypothetical protein